MSTVSLRRSARSGDLRTGLPFALAALAVGIVAAFLSGWLPIGFSIVTVFLFAGPHNWLELRYFMGRMPARLGPLRGYFLFAFAGIFGLTAAYAVLNGLAYSNRWQDDTLLHAAAFWNTALVLWIGALVHLRSRQKPLRDWSWVWPVAFLLIALNWYKPTVWGLGLVYLHPLIAFWVLDRELRRSKPAWRPAYHLVLCILPILLGVLWWKLSTAPNLADEDDLSWRITYHAGADLLPNVSSHLLVATHTFLEMLHYGVWVIVIPLIAYRARPWKLDVPLARRSLGWKRGLLALLGMGVFVVLLLWVCFLTDYSTTRDVYFTVALLHVLAEAPFLLRAL